MVDRFKLLIFLLAAVAVITTLSMAIMSIAAQRGPVPQSTVYRAPRLADGHPDLNGIWQAFVTANWSLVDHEAQPGLHPELIGEYGAGPAGQSIVEGGEIPYQAWALQKRKQNFEK